MNKRNMAALRLQCQQITDSKFATPEEIVSWMGAIQAQDYRMAKWAIGVRAGCTENVVAEALHKGDILRTHVLRPTWHFAAAADLHWMLQLTAPRIRAAMKSHNRQLGLSDAVFRKSREFLENALKDNTYVTREELKQTFQKNKFRLDENRLSHLLMDAELACIICSGETSGALPAYRLMAPTPERVAKMNKEDMLARLARRYFLSRGPATLQDFTWWSGLSAPEAKQALMLVKEDFICEKMGDQDYFFDDAVSLSKPVKMPVFLLPAFDEFLISYKDRSASLDGTHHAKYTTLNGIFHPIIVINGQVAGTWKRTLKKEEVIISATFFEPIKKTHNTAVGKAADAFARFLNKKTQGIG